MFEDLKLPKRQTNCRVRTIVADLTAKDKELFLTAVMNPEWPYKTLSNELYKRGTKISDAAIKHHREKRCSCLKD
jgi:hypothetical protein